MRGREDLFVTAKFADDLVVTSMSGRRLQRAMRRHGTRNLCRSHVVIRAGSSGIEPGAQEPVRDLNDRAVLASLAIGLNFHCIAHFHSVQQTMVIVSELVCTLVACCLKNLVRSIDADAGGTKETAAACDSAEGKRDTLTINVVVSTGTGGIRQRRYKTISPFARLNVVRVRANA